MLAKRNLARHFIEIDPRGAAKVIEGLDASSSSSFIAAEVDGASGTLLSSMLPYHAGKVVSQIAPDVAAACLGTLDARAIAAILRHVPEEVIELILRNLPRRIVARTKLVLNYSQAMVGAWAEPMVLAPPSNCTASEARTRLLNDEFGDFSRIHVVDDKQKPVGFVRLTRLLKASEDETMADLLERQPGMLGANTSLELASEEAAWTEVDFLPVVNRSGEYIGVLRHSTMRSALARPRAQQEDKDIAGSFMDLAETCYLGLADVMNTSLAVEKSAERREGQ